MKRLLLLPYLITTLVGYIVSVVGMCQAQDVALWNKITAVSWCATTIMGLAVGLAATEW